MKNVPKKIYLNLGFNKDECADFDTIDFNELTQISWSTERLNDADIEFQLAIGKDSDTAP